MRELLSVACALMVSCVLAGCDEKSDPRDPPNVGTGATGNASGTGASSAGGGGASVGGAGAGGDSGGSTATGGSGGSGGLPPGIGNCDCVTNIYQGDAACDTCAQAALVDMNTCFGYQDQCTNTAGCQPIVDCMAACPASDGVCMALCLGDTTLPEGSAARDLHSCLCEVCGQECAQPLMCD